MPLPVVTTIPALVGDWKAARHPAASTARQMDRVAHDLQACSHVSDPAALRRGDLRAFLADLRAHHRPPTAHKKFALAHALLQFGLEQGVLDVNPSDGMQVHLTGSGPTRLPFGPDDLTRIFSDRVFTAHWIPPQRSAGGIAAFWLPLILLCTAAPLEKAGVLRKDDVAYSSHAPAIPYFRFRAHWNRAPAREYLQPVHPYLLRLGLLDYVDSLPADSRLFPLLIPDSEGRLTARFASYFGRFLRQRVGITDPHKVLASFRQTFAHACRQHEITYDVRLALLGREDARDIALRFDYGVPLPALHAAMTRLTFAGFPL